MPPANRPRSEHARNGHRRPSPAAALALVLSLAAPASVTAQTLDHDVLGAAGGWVSGGGLQLGMTVGEAVVGLAIPAPGTIAEVAGFWGPGQVPVLSVGGPTAPPVAGRFGLAIRPNPFAGETVLSWSVPARPRATPARAEIFDARGRRVRALETGAPASGGVISFTWDGRDERGNESGPGLYFCRLAAGEHTVTGRLARIR